MARMTRRGILATGIAVIPAGWAAQSRPAAAQQSILRVGSTGTDISTLDPHRAQQTQDRTLVSWMFNGLVRFPPGSADPAAFEPDLAERWGSSPDGLTWTFHLRKGVKFHGEWGEMNAEDVVHSIRRAADPKRSSFAKDYRAIDRVEAMGPNTVLVTFKANVPSVLGLFCNYQGGFVVSKKADEQLGDKFKTQPVGTGPFMFDRHETQREVVLKAHSGHFRGKPQIGEIRNRFINSDSTRELAFTSGELDLMAGRRDQRWVTRMRAAPNAVIDIFAPAEFRTLHINMRIEPLSDRRVREAIARAIDTKQIWQFAGTEIARIGKSVVPPGYLGESGDSWTYTHDLERARALLKEAGHPDLKIKAVVSNISAQQPVMEVIQAQLRKAGITLEMEVVDHPTYHAQIRKDVSALVFYGAARFPVADTYLSEFYHSRAIIGTPTAALNFSHCKAADAEIDAAQKEINQSKQKVLYAEAQRKIHETICSVPLFDLAQVWVRSKRVDLGYELKGAMNLAPPVTEKTRLL